MDTRFTPQLKKKCKIDFITHPKLYPILKAGPTTKNTAVNSAAVSLIKASRIWLRSGELLKSLKTFAEQMGASEFVHNLGLTALAYDPRLDTPQIEEEIDYSIFHIPNSGFARLIGLSL